MEWALYWTIGIVCNEMARDSFYGILRKLKSRIALDNSMYMKFELSSNASQLNFHNGLLCNVLKSHYQGTTKYHQREKREAKGKGQDRRIL